jgi:hypothetical protein
VKFRGFFLVFLKKIENSLTSWLLSRSYCQISGQASEKFSSKYILAVDLKDNDRKFIICRSSSNKLPDRFRFKKLLKPNFDFETLLNGTKFKITKQKQVFSVFNIDFISFKV